MASAAALKRLRKKFGLGEYSKGKRRRKRRSYVARRRAPFNPQDSRDAGVRKKRKGSKQKRHTPAKKLYAFSL